MRRSEEAITITVPFRVRQYGGRKQVLTPDGMPVSERASPLLDSPLVREILSLGPSLRAAMRLRPIRPRSLKPLSAHNPIRRKDLRECGS